MALTLDESRYPLSSADGKVIRLEVLGPVSYRRVAVDDAAMSAALTIADYEDMLLEIRSDVEVVIAFSQTPVDLVAELGHYVIPADEKVVLLPLLGFYSFIVPVASASGTVQVNIIRKWNTLAIKVDEG